MSKERIKKEGVLELVEECPKCSSRDIKPDPDYESMSRCKVCGAEWTADDLVLDPAEV